MKRFLPLLFISSLVFAGSIDGVKTNLTSKNIFSLSYTTNTVANTNLVIVSGAGLSGVNGTYSWDVASGMYRYNPGVEFDVLIIPSEGGGWHLDYYDPEFSMYGTPYFGANFDGIYPWDVNGNPPGPMVVHPTSTAITTNILGLIISIY